MHQIRAPFKNQGWMDVGWTGTKVLALAGRGSFYVKGKKELQDVSFIQKFSNSSGPCGSYKISFFRVDEGIQAEEG